MNQPFDFSDELACLVQRRFGIFGKRFREFLLVEFLPAVEQPMQHL